MTVSSKTSCAQGELVAEYAVRALPAAEMSAFEGHLGECPHCREDLAAVRPVIDSFVDWPTDVLRPAKDLWERLASSLGGDSTPKPSIFAALPEPDAGWAAEPSWEEVAPGISCKILASDSARHRVSMLVRLAPGVEYPPHTHAGVEELHLLDGELWIDDRLLRPGDYNRAEPGTADKRVWSETGCTCVLLTSSRDVLS